MAAIVFPSPSSTASAAPASRPQPGSRPPLRLIPGGAGRPSRATYLRRRVVAGVLALVLGVSLLAVGWAALEAWAPPPPANPAGTHGPVLAASAASSVVVVHAGDTLWSIARRLQPTGDLRPLVNRLAAAHGSGPLLPGDRIPVTGPGAPPAG